jgi:ankyrin repeat protein
VWFWDSTAFWDSEDEPSVHWLADSFNDFLTMLELDVCTEEEEEESLPLFLAVERGNLTAVERHLAGAGDVNARNQQGHTLLTAAAIHQWPKIVRLLLEHSAEPNARDLLGRTPLHHAAMHSIDSVKLLLAAGADAKARDSECKSVLGGWSYRADQILRAHGAAE